MGQAVKHIDVRDLREVPAWEQLVEEVRTTKTPAILQADGEDIAELRPAPARRPRIPPGKPTTADDPLWTIIGIAIDELASNVSEQHDQYLADAYSDTHEP